MASTYSTNLKIELMGTGDQPGTWGTTTNTNLGTALEQAIVGYGNPIFASDADLTITLTDSNATQTARAFALNVTSGVSLTTTRNLIVPTIQKPYLIFNNTSGSQSILVKTSAGTGVTVPNGARTLVYVDGTNVVSAVSNLPSLTLNTALAVSSGGTGASTLTANNVILGNGTSAVQFVAPGSSGNLLTSNGTTWQSTAPAAVNLASGVTGTLPVANGGTGQTTYTNGQLLIGNTTGNTLTKATLTAGTGITITNGTGSITVANAGVTSFNGGTGAVTGAATDLGNLGVGMMANGAVSGSTVAAGSTTGSFQIAKGFDAGTPAITYTSVAGTWRNISGITADSTSSYGLATFQRIS